MARVSQYKALGTKLGGYKSTLSKIESKEYGKKHADWKAQEEISLYNQIGGTVANVIGIAQESRLAREQADTYARDYGIDPGDKFAKRVTKQGLKDNPFLDQTDKQFWADENMSDKIVGLPKTPDAQPSLFEGEPGETPRQGLVGGIADTETAYQESLKRFSPSPSKSAHQLESENLKKGLADDKVFNAMNTYDEPIGTVIQSQKIAEADESGQKVLDESKSLYEQTLKEGDKIADRKMRAERLGLSVEEVKKREDAGAPAGLQQETPGFGYRGEHDARSRERRERESSTPTKGGEPYYAGESPSSSKVFDAIKGDDSKPIIPSGNKFYGKLDSNQKQNLETAGKVGGSYAQKVMMRESSGGVNTGDSSRAGSMFQFKQGGAYVGDQKIPEGVIGNPEKETKYFMDYNKQITKDFSKPKASRKSSGGKSIYKIAESHGLSQEATNYGAHQQGASGFQDIITAADSGNLSGGNTRILKMLNNITPEQSKQLNSKYRKASGLTHQSLKDSGEIKSFIQDWLSMQQESWDAMEGDFY